MVDKVDFKWVIIMQIIERPCLVAEYNETPFMKYQNYTVWHLWQKKHQLSPLNRAKQLNWTGFKKSYQNIQQREYYLHKKFDKQHIYNMNYSGQAIATVVIVIPNNIEVY